MLVKSVCGCVIGRKSECVLTLARSVYWTVRWGGCGRGMGGVGWVGLGVQGRTVQ